MEPKTEECLTSDLESKYKLIPIKNMPSSGIVRWSKSLARCLLCGVFVPKANRCIEQHETGAQHRESVKRTSRNGIGFINSDIYCKLCDIILPKEEYVINHINGLAHSKWMNLMKDVLIMGEFANFDKYLALEAEDIYCTLCQVHVQCDHDIIADHTATADHMANIFESLRYGHGMFFLHNDKVWCKLCKLKFKKDMPKLLDHIGKDKHHLSKLARLEDLNQFEGVGIMKYLTVKEETKVHCERCNLSIDCSYPAIETHIHTQCHTYRVVSQI